MHRTLCEQNMFCASYTFIRHVDEASDAADDAEAGTASLLDLAGKAFLISEEGDGFIGTERADAPLASKAHAEAGTAKTVHMTPLRTNQAIDEFATSTSAQPRAIIPYSMLMY